MNHKEHKSVFADLNLVKWHMRNGQEVPWLGGGKLLEVHKCQC